MRFLEEEGERGEGGTREPLRRRGPTRTPPLSIIALTHAPPPPASAATALQAVASYACAAVAGAADFDFSFFDSALDLAAAAWSATVLVRACSSFLRWMTSISAFFVL